MKETTDRGEEERTQKWLDENEREYKEVELQVDDSYPGSGGSRKADIVAFVSDRDPVVVDVFEVKEYLCPRAIGQILWYARALPEVRDVVVRDKGIIFDEEHDGLSRRMAEENQIKLVQL